ncbi:DNA alkylation repair protein [Lysobacter sp. S4-A87]|uniref:DNA alkylation repair protein n=1 Tax=Lysobacter sp. S4-A87 TaxID=2925843 RepID=UPI001F533E4A|nr:DNA alkylation repair protein [Lysobacter sp. S4-A87]UNK49545.1 DNA alkylation repair protein [Lysobacter sp. S4-A87]
MRPSVEPTTARPRKPVAAGAAREATLDQRLEQALQALHRRASKATLDGMARYAIPSDHAIGVAMKDIQAVAKAIGHDHELAQALWGTGMYEARTLAAYVDDPAQVTAAQMDRWCRECDNWAIVDTVCFVLFDRTPHAWRKVVQWSGRRGELEKRAAFALMASMALHGRLADEATCVEGLALIERAAGDERNFVIKGASWALRSIGRRNARLHAQAITLATRLAGSDVACERWLGKDALRDLRKPAVVQQLAKGGRKK